MRKVAFVFAILLLGFVGAQQFEKVELNNNAIDFSLKTVQGDEIQLSQMYKNHPVVLVVLRGWPGYQCPVCSRQVGSLVGAAENFAELGAVVFMVYPGPSSEMQKHADEFIEDFDFPENFYFTLDPEYSMINKYGLRWEAPKETAYPSTFVIDSTGKIVFSKVSTTHSGRASVEELLNVLKKL
jgi:peroxiredoxin